MPASRTRRLAYGPFRLEGGARYDWTAITPDLSAGGVLTDVRSREFGAVSASLAATFDIGSGLLLGASLARAFRTPSIEELYSAGPHLADYSFNIGNPELDAEFGFGTDLFVRMTRPRVHAEATIFRNSIDNFIYHAPTGELDPRLGRFPVFQATSDDALLMGAEGKVQWEVMRSVVLTGHLSYVRGTRQGDDEPLPAIPPVTGGFEGRYEGRRYFAGLGLDASGRQDRVPRAPGFIVGTGTDSLRCRDEAGRPLLECPTAGYGLLNATSGMRWTAWDRMHTLTLNINNLTDAVWRDHLSRIKEVAPQPGRNVQLLYRVEF